MNKRCQYNFIWIEEHARSIASASASNIHLTQVWGFFIIRGLFCVSLSPRMMNIDEVPFSDCTGWFPKEPRPDRPSRSGVGLIYTHELTLCSHRLQERVHRKSFVLTLSRSTTDCPFVASTSSCTAVQDASPSV